MCPRFRVTARQHLSAGPVVANDIDPYRLRMARGWNKQELADAGRRTEDDEDNSILCDYVGEELFMKWRERGMEIVVSERDRQWELGAWVVEGEDMKDAAALTSDQRFKNSVYKAAADITGHSVKTIKSLAYVVRNVPPAVKDEFRVSFAHLKLVAKYDLKEQRDYLREIEVGNLNVKEARDRVRFLAGERIDKTSVADRHAKRITWHCEKLTESIENPRLDEMSPFVRKTLLEKVNRLRKDLELMFAEEVAEVVSNHR